MARVFKETEVREHYRSASHAGPPEFELIRKSEGDLYPSVTFLGRVDDLKALDEHVSRILRPTVEQLYEQTLHGFDETNGDVEAPTGWFALVDWPNGKAYLIDRDERGNMTLLGEAERFTPESTELGNRYQALIEEYDAWTDIAEQEA